MLEIQYRPMRVTDWKRPSYKRKASLFKSNWSSTLILLEREIKALKGTDVTIELEVVPAAIRADGTGLKAHQRPASVAVVLSFDTKDHGEFVWQADAYTEPAYGRGDGWRHNVHAIAKTLEALRAVERYGLVSGQQYEGLAALPSGSGTAPSGLVLSEAERILLETIGVSQSEVRGRTWKSVMQAAKVRAHPDRHGSDRTMWDLVEQAARVIERSGKECV